MTTEKIINTYLITSKEKYHNNTIVFIPIKKIETKIGIWYEGMKYSYHLPHTITFVIISEKEFSSLFIL